MAVDPGMRPLDVDRYVGSRLRDLRKARRLSLTELGASIEVTYQQIQKYETGANRISASTLWALCQNLQVPVAYFFPSEDVSFPRNPLDPFDRIEDDRVREAARSLIFALGQDRANADR